MSADDPRKLMTFEAFKAVEYKDCVGKPLYPYKRVDKMKEEMIKQVFVPLGIDEDKPFGELKLPRMRDSMAQMTCKPVGVNGLSVSAAA